MNIGQRAEEQAKQFLLKKGLRYITKNYRCRLGEIDLVMWDGCVLVFVEVRMRRVSRYGFGFETVTRTKQCKMIKTAWRYLQYHPHDGMVRFDVVSIDGPLNTMTWIQDAFSEMHNK